MRAFRRSGLSLSPLSFLLGNLFLLQLIAAVHLQQGLGLCDDERVRMGWRGWRVRERWGRGARAFSFFLSRLRLLLNLPLSLSLSPSFSLTCGRQAGRVDEIVPDGGAVLVIDAHGVATGGGGGGAAAACVGPCVQVVEGELRVQGTLEGRRSVSTGRAGFLFLFFPRVPARGHAVWGDAPDAGVCIAIPIHRPASRGTGSGECALNWGQRGGRGARALKGAPRPRRALMLLSRARPLRAP